MKKSILIVAAAAALLFSGCAKDGATGPQGPAGANGTNGAANISISFQVANFSLVSSVYEANLSVPAITSYVNCAVMVYLSAASSIQFALPVSNYYQPGDEFAFSFTNGAVTIYYFEGSVNHVEVSEAVEIIVIPQSIMKKHPGINWNDINQVKALPEASGLKL